jgi:hypothetical protein
MSAAPNPAGADHPTTARDQVSMRSELKAVGGVRGDSARRQPEENPI